MAYDYGPTKGSHTYIVHLLNSFILLYLLISGGVHPLDVKVVYSTWAEISTQARTTGINKLFVQSCLAISDRHPVRGCPFQERLLSLILKAVQSKQVCRPS